MSLWFGFLSLSCSKCVWIGSFNFLCSWIPLSSVDLQAVTDGLEERTGALETAIDDHESRISAAEENIQGNSIKEKNYVLYSNKSCHCQNLLK